MRRRFATRWIGYDPHEVDQTSALMDHDHQHELAKLQEEHTILIASSSKVRARSEALTAELTRLRSVEKDMAATLLNSHLRSAQIIVAAMVKAEQADLVAQQQITANEAEVAKLEQQYQHLGQEIRILADRYGAVMGGAKGVG